MTTIILRASKGSGLTNTEIDTNFTNLNTDKAERVSPTLVTPVLGTPASATLTNATGLPVATGISGLASGIANFLATPTSANLAAALTDETGTGAAVFATSPVLVTPALGTPTSAILTNATGLPLTSGITGTLAVANGGTGVTTSTGTGDTVLSTSPTLVTPVLGTPASGVMTNVTGTAAGLTAGTVTTNANLTGVVTSTGNATAIADAALSIAKTSGLQAALDLKQNLSAKDAANGYAGLDASSKINPSQLPALAITDTFVVASQAAQIAVTAEVGDVVVRTDLNKSFILQTSPASTFANWQELLTPTDVVGSVFGRTGVVTAQSGDYTAAQVGAPAGSGNSTGTNTGDQTNISGNAATVTTNANLTGPVTSVGNATSFTSGMTIPAFTLGGTVSGGGNQINNVIIGTSTPLAGAFTTLTTSSTVTINGGTANGVAYLDGSKVLTTGSALTFDGTQAKLTANPPTLVFNGTTSNSARGLLFENSGTQFARMTANYNNGDFRFVSGETGQNGYFFAWFTDGSEKMRLDPSGRLGIGTVSPTYTLDVVGTIAATQNSAGLAGNFVNSDATNGYGVSVAAGGTSATRYSLVVRNPAGTQDWFKVSSVTGEVGNSIFAPGAPSSPVVATISTAGLAVTGALSATGVSSASTGFSTYLAGGTNYVRLGTANYAFKIETPADNATLVIRRDDGNSGHIATFAFGSLAVTGVLDVTGVGSFSQLAPSNTTYKTSAFMNFYPGNDNVWLFHAGTNWGDPFIAVNGTTAGTTITGALANSLVISGNGTGGVILSNGTTADVVLKSGNLGLGVTPSATVTKSIQVGPSAGFTGDGITYGWTAAMSQNAYMFGNNTWKYIGSTTAALYLQDGNVHRWYNAPSGTLGDTISFTQAMTLNASGNLGIGTTSPAARLEIKGDSNEKFILNATLDTNSYQNQITFQNAGTTYAAIVAGKNASNVSLGLVFNTGTTEKMRLDSSGNLGIGTISPATKLDVNGTVTATGFSGPLTGCTVDGTHAVGFRNIPQNTQSAAYTLVLADSGKHIFHDSGAAAATYTIPANSSVAYPIGTTIAFVSLSSATVTIAITTDTMYLSGSGTTGSRSLAQYGAATALKIAATTWMISGSGLT